MRFFNTNNSNDKTPQPDAVKDAGSGTSRFGVSHGCAGGTVASAKTANSQVFASLKNPSRRCPQSIALAWACLLVFFTISVVTAQQPAPANGTLQWINGDSLPGHVVSADAQILRWQAGQLFRAPVDIDHTWLKNIELETDPTAKETTGTYVVQLIDGYSLKGEITSLDEKTLEITSPRFGTVAVKRSRIATILNQTTSGSLVSGDFDLTQWEAKRGKKKYWEVDEQGRLQSKRKDIHLYLEKELPKSLLVEVEFTWKDNLDFSFGFGVPTNVAKLESLPRLESWDGAIVLSFADDFETVLESVDEEAQRLKLLMHWDRVDHQIVIHDEQGQLLAKADIGKPSKNIKPGIFLENKAGDLTIGSLALRNSTATFNATKPSIQSLDAPATNAEIKSFDGQQWTVSTQQRAEENLNDDGDADEQDDSDSEGRSEDDSEGQNDDDSDAAEQADTKTDTQQLDVQEFCGAFLINSSIPRSTKETQLRFADGMVVGGDLVAIENDRATLETQFSDEPISFLLSGATSLRFSGKAAKKKTSESSKHRLYTKAGTISGQLEPGSGEAGDVLRWQLPGAAEPSTFSNGDARIVLQPRKQFVAESDDYGDTLYLKNRDTIPCHVVGIDEKTVEIDSFVETRLIDQQLIKAIDFRNDIVSDTIEVDDENWAVAPNSKRKFKVSKDEIQLRKDAQFGHPWLFSTGKVEFEIDWQGSQYGALECRALAGSLEDDNSGKKFNIVLYGNAAFVCDAGQVENSNKQIPVPKSKARITLEYQRGKLLVRVNGKKAWLSKVESSQNQGRGIYFRLNDLYQQKIRCTLSNFKLSKSQTGGSQLMDPERRDMMLTLPRLKKLNPPRHVLCATNGDMLRGDLLKMDQQFVRFRSSQEEQRFARSVAGSLVWLHAEHLAQSDDDDDDDEETDANPKEADAVPSTTQTPVTQIPGQQTVQILMQGNRRMTAALEAWEDETLAGRSEVLGSCRVPIEQIYELRLGSYAQEAVDVPYSDWEARLAPQPNMEAGGGRDGETLLFGGSSPLIGTTPDSFTAKMLDETSVTLSSLRGKVVVLDFWATWCGPCVQALPGIKKVIDDFPTDDVAFLAINQEEGASTIQAFLDSRKLELPVALDSGKIGEQFGLESLPLTVVIDRAGKVAFVKVGSSPKDDEKLTAAIEQLLLPPAEADQEEQDDKS